MASAGFAACMGGGFNILPVVWEAEIPFRSIAGDCASGTLFSLISSISVHTIRQAAEIGIGDSLHWLPQILALT
jgi:hypothetical protein